MISRAEELIKLLKLVPHPEGGFYREVFRSSKIITTADGQSKRSALTTIYYLLTKGDYSCWHRVKSDEVWYFCEGANLRLFCIEPEKDEYKQFNLGYPDRISKPSAVIPAGCWQAAETSVDYALVGCTVGPGFEFDDFEMMCNNPQEEQKLRHTFPELVKFL